jgi:hypothetical protein
MALLSRTLGVPEVAVAQVQVPDGTITVSPDAAELMADCTAEAAQDEALTVAAREYPEKATQKATEARMAPERRKCRPSICRLLLLLFEIIGTSILVPILTDKS